MDSVQNKRRINWGLLLIFLGIAASLNVLFGFDQWEVVAVFGVGFLATFAYYLTDRTDLLLAIPAYILFALTAISGLALADVLMGELIATLVLSLIGLPFLVVFLVNRSQNWWALIPAYVMFSIAVMIFLIGIGVLNDAWIALYVLSSIGIPFLVVYLINRTNWWALIPAYVMFVIGIMVTLIDVHILNDLAIPAYVMFAIAIPFLFVYLTNREQWWALIPGGIMTVIGLGFWAGTDLAQYVIPAVLILAGILVLFRSVKK
jgi:hypothetical protein